MGYYAGDFYQGAPVHKLKGGKLAKLGKLKKHGKAAMAGLGKGLQLVQGMKGLRGARAHHRRMHVTNVRALRRAMRRVQGFAKLARKTIGFTHRVHMKKHRRR